MPTVPLASPSSPSPDRTNRLDRSRATCYTGSKPSDVRGLQGGTSMQHLWPNDSHDDGNALARLLHTVLKEVGAGLSAFVVAFVAFIVFWVAAALLLHQLAP
jgi:hypothetical protein